MFTSGRNAFPVGALTSCLLTAVLLWLTACVQQPHTPAPRAPEMGPPRTAESAYPSPQAHPAPPPRIARPTETPTADITAASGRIKVGLLVPLSGKDAALGQALQDAATLALFDKYSTLARSSPRHEIELLPKDTRGTPEGAQTAAKAALNEGARLLLGPLYTHSVRAVTPIAQRVGVPLLTFSNNARLANSGALQFGFMPEEQARRVVGAAHAHNVAFYAALAPATAYGRTVVEAFAAETKKRGVHVAPIELYELDTPNLARVVEPVATALKERSPKRQALFIAERGARLKEILTALEQFEVPRTNLVLLGTGLWDDAAIRSLPQMVNSWFASAPPEIYRGFEGRFKSRLRLCSTTHCQPGL